MKIRYTIVVDRELDEDEFNWLHHHNLLDSTHLTEHHNADEDFLTEILDATGTDQLASLNAEVLND